MLLDLRVLFESVSTQIDSGGITINGQSVTLSLSGNLSLPIAAGAVSVAGQSVVLAQSFGITAGSVGVTGQSFTLSYGIALAGGAVTVAGQTATIDVGSPSGSSAYPAPFPSISGLLQPANNLFATIEPGAVSVTGQSLAFGSSIALSAGAVSVTGQTLTPALITGTGTPNPSWHPALSSIQQSTSNLGLAIDTAGIVLVTGQDVPVALSNPELPAIWHGLFELPPAYFAEQMHLALRWREWQQGVENRDEVGGSIPLPIDTAGQVTVTGQSVRVAPTFTVTAGAVAVAGQTATFLQSVGIQAGSVTIAGQSITAVTSGNIVVSIEAGAVRVSGQSCNIAPNIGTAAGAVTVAGQSLVLTSGITPNAGNIVIAGSGVELLAAGSLSLGIEAGAVTISGQSMPCEIKIAQSTAGAVTIAGQNVLALRDGDRNLDIDAGHVSISGQSIALVLTGLVIDATRKRFVAEADPQLFQVKADPYLFTADRDPTDFTL